jgi:hypothetical protein
VASRKPNDRIHEWLAAHAVTRVTERIFADLAAAFPGVGERTLRQAVRQSSLPLNALVEGVRQDSLEELARTLGGLQAEYQSAVNDRSRQRRIRSIVIESKSHARFAARRKPDKLEMVEWMLVWLGDPSLFDTWAKLRLRLLAGERGTRGVTNPDTGQADQH